MSLILPTVSSRLLPGPRKSINTVLISQLNILVFAQKEKGKKTKQELGVLVLSRLLISFESGKLLQAPGLAFSALEGDLAQF